MCKKIDKDFKLRNYILTNIIHQYTMIVSGELLPYSGEV